jgi:hypothetical protein
VRYALAPILIFTHGKAKTTTMRKHLSTLALSISFLLSAHDTQSMAQSNPTFMQLGRAKSALYKPDSGPEPHVGIIVMHRESN